MNKALARISIVGALVFGPVAAFANTSLGNVLATINGLITAATPIVVALALLGFFWGLAVFIFNAGDEKKRASGRQIMIYGVLALFVMLSVFGIIGLLQSTFGVGNQRIDIPSVQTNVSGPGNFY